MAFTKQLFLSKRVVTEAEIFDGGVLVDDDGKIEKLLKRKESDVFIAENKGNIKVGHHCTAAIYKF